MESFNETYDFSTNIRNKEVKYRKWKVKDKKKFLAYKDDRILLKEALVYDCLEDKKIALSEEEFKYMLIHIREASLSNRVKYVFPCSVCNEEFEYITDLIEIMKPVYKDYGLIEYKGHSFIMDSIINRSFYEQFVLEAVSFEAAQLIDFMLHIKSYNDNDAFTFEELNDIINELDIEVFENIFKQWDDMRFKVDNTHIVKCPHCGFEELYEFDDLPEFFPDSWNL